MRMAQLGENTKVYNPELSNVGNAKIGDNCVIHSHVWIGDDVVIGNNVKIQAFSFIPSGVVIGDNVFIGPGVTFTNDKNPEVSKERGDTEWKPETTTVENGANIGARATILPGLTIGKGSTIGAGSVVTRSVPPNVVVCGSPANIHAGKK